MFYAIPSKQAIIFSGGFLTIERFLDHKLIETVTTDMSNHLLKAHVSKNVAK